MERNMIKPSKMVIEIESIMFRFQSPKQLKFNFFT